MLKSKKILTIIRRLVLLLLITAMLITVNEVVERKTVGGAWNYSLKVGGFKNEPENTFDIIGFGSSHMYCTLTPVYLYEQTGLRSYVLATQQQPIDATYYYIKEALKTQIPDILVVEALMFIRSDNVEEGVAHDAIDPFPESINKYKMVNSLNIDGSKESYYVNFLKYHTRWKELTKNDYSFSYKNETDPFHGFVFLNQIKNTGSCRQVSYDTAQEIPLSENSTEMLKKIQNLAAKSNTELLLLISPYALSNTDLGMYKSLHKFAVENKIDILDLNTVYDELGINNETDFYDSGHLNVFGAEKATSYIGKYIKNNYHITDKNADDSDLWNADIEYYNSLKTIENKEH